MVYIVSSGCNILFFSPAFPGCFKPLSVTFQRGFFFLLSSKSRKNIILFACLYVMYNWCKKNGTCEALVSGWQHQAVFPLIAMFSCKKVQERKVFGIVISEILIAVWLRILFWDVALHHWAIGPFPSQKLS